MIALWQAELGYLGGKGEASIGYSAKLNNRISAHRQTDQLKGTIIFHILQKVTLRLILLHLNTTYYKYSCYFANAWLAEVLSAD